MKLGNKVVTGEVDCDSEGIALFLEQIGERVTRGVAAMMTDEGEKIANKAISNAPVDTEGLEEAIDWKDTRTGLHGRTEVKIFVDMNHVNKKGESVGDYAWDVHEELAPYGNGKIPNLGKDSKKKRDSGHDVGGKFLERAAEERREIINYRAKEIAERVPKT